MKHIGCFTGIVVIAFLLAIFFNVDNTMSGESCCGIKEGAKAVSSEEKSDNDCPVCGKAADSKGNQVDVEHDGKTVHLCCEGCANAYNANPDKYSKSESEKPGQSHREQPKERKQRGEGYY